MKKIFLLIFTLGLFSIFAQEKKNINWSQLLESDHTDTIKELGIPNMIDDTSFSGLNSENCVAYVFEYDGYMVYLEQPYKNDCGVRIERGLVLSGYEITEPSKVSLPLGLEESDNFNTIIQKLGTPSAFSNSQLKYILDAKNGRYWDLYWLNGSSSCKTYDKVLINLSEKNTIKSLFYIRHHDCTIIESRK